MHGSGRNWFSHETAVYRSAALQQCRLASVRMAGGEKTICLLPMRDAGGLLLPAS